MKIPASLYFIQRKLNRPEWWIFYWKFGYVYDNKNIPKHLKEKGKVCWSLKIMCKWISSYRRVALHLNDKQNVNFPNLSSANANTTGAKKKKKKPAKTNQPTQTPTTSHQSNANNDPATTSTNQLFESIPNEHGPDKLILNTNHTLEMLEQIPSNVVQEKLDDGKHKRGLSALIWY